MSPYVLCPHTSFQHTLAGLVTSQLRRSFQPFQGSTHPILLMPPGEHHVTSSTMACNTTLGSALPEASGLSPSTLRSQNTHGNYTGREAGGEAFICGGGAQLAQGGCRRPRPGLRRKRQDRRRGKAAETEDVGLFHPLSSPLPRNAFSPTSIPGLPSHGKYGLDLKKRFHLVSGPNSFCWVRDSEATCK